MNSFYFDSPDPVIFGQENYMLKFGFTDFSVLCRKCITILNVVHFIFLILFWFSFSLSSSLSFSSPMSPSTSSLHSFHRNISSVKLHILKISRTKILLHIFHLLVSTCVKINLNRNKSFKEESALQHLCQINILPLCKSFHLENCLSYR